MKVKNKHLKFPMSRHKSIIQTGYWLVLGKYFVPFVTITLQWLTTSSLLRVLLVSDMQPLLISFWHESSMTQNTNNGSLLNGNTYSNLSSSSHVVTPKQEIRDWLWQNYQYRCDSCSIIILKDKCQHFSNPLTQTHVCV